MPIGDTFLGNPPQIKQYLLGFKPVEYIEVTEDGQYFDTGIPIKGSSFLNVTAAFEFYRPNNNAKFDCGAEESWTANIWRFVNLLQKDDGQYAKTWFRAGKTVASASSEIAEGQFAASGKKLEVIL